METNRRNPLGTRAGQQEDLGQKQTEGAPREFGTVEALLRHDAEQTAPPPGLEERVAAAVQREPAQPRSFWQRLFGGER